MPIPEPLDSPLWKAVQGRVRWPSADEDVTAQLGRDWDDAVATFRYAASSTRELPDNAWPDEVGAVFDDRIAKLRDRVYRDADGMARLARITTAYGEDVGHVKSEINRVLPSWEPQYSAHPAEAANAFGTLVNGFLQQMAQRIRDRKFAGPETAEPNRPALLTPRDALALAAALPPGGQVPLPPDPILRVNRNKQAGHIFGTPEYKNRLKIQDKDTSYFANEREANTYTYEAWYRGTPVHGSSTVRELDFGRPIGIGPKGGYQTRVRVTMDADGQVHGSPIGPEIPR